MNKISLLCSAFLALACQPLISQAATPVAATGGVSVALTTSGYEFTPKIGVLLKPGGGTEPLPPQLFAAAIALSNHTASDIPCTLGVTGTPGASNFEFRLYNSKGELVWDSLPAVTMPLEMLTALKAGETWHGSVSVPLFPKGGLALPAGRYTLEASLFGSPVFRATTSIVIHNIIAIN